MARRHKAILLSMFWLLVGVVYVWAAWQQKQRVNLSAAAGGQYPYLAYAKGIAEAGITEHFGDRNRMPLYPSLLAFFYQGDWDEFVERSAWVAIASSLIVLTGVGWLLYRPLPLLPATALVLSVTVSVFVYQASFVQAELLYYGLLFVTWWQLGRVIHKPNWRGAILGGFLLAGSYLTKASALATLAAFLFTAIIQSLVLLIRPKSSYRFDAQAPAFDKPCEGPAPADKRPKPVDRRRISSVASAAALVVIIFLATVYPYISHNKTRFGRYFYNVNSTFFMWCDSWSQAKAFADTHPLAERWPVADAEKIPGPRNYWRTHTLGQMAGRLGYGMKTLCHLALRGPYLKYILLVAVFCVMMGARRVNALSALLRRRWTALLFSGTFFGGYILAYAWYVPVAYGDRFVLSLLLPALFSLWRLGVHLSDRAKPWRLGQRRILKCDALAVGALALALGDGTIIVTTSLYHPGEEFIRFYYNESRELLKAGNLREASKGFSGVIQLDGSFALAHHELGMIDLTRKNPQRALPSLYRAVELRPGDANLHNSLGSALIQVGRTDEAVTSFRSAVELDPAFTTAWYNLGGAYRQLGRSEQAMEVRQRLEMLDSDLARRLSQLIGHGE